MFGKAFSQGSRLSFGESNVLCGFSTAWGSVLPTPALLKGHPYRWRDVYFKELTHLPWGYQVWDVKPAGDPRSPRRCPEPTGSMEQERHPLRIGWPRGLLKPVVEFPGQLGKSQVHCMGSGGRVMVCGARALRPHCNHHHLPSSENSRQPLPIPTESDSSPGDSNAHRVGSQLCREKRGGGLEIIRRVLLPTYQSSQLRHCSGSQTHCTPSHRLQCQRESPQITLGHWHVTATQNTLSKHLC